MTKPEQDQWLPTRKSLVSRLKHLDDQESWRDFFYTYWRLIYQAAMQAGLTDEEGQEVVQETVIKVARKMEGFRYDPGRDSFKGWLLYLTRKGIEKQFHKRQRAQGRTSKSCRITEWSGQAEQVADPAFDLEAAWDHQWETNLMDAAIERVKQRVDAKQFQIFNYYVLKEMPARQVARTMKVSSARVYMAKHRLLQLIRKEISHLEKHGYRKGAVRKW